MRKRISVKQMVEKSRRRRIRGEANGMVRKDSTSGRAGNGSNPGIG